MRHHFSLRNFVPTLLAGGFVIASGAAGAQTLVSDFNDFALNGTYGSWSSATITSGPDSYRVDSAGGFGGGFYDIDPNAMAMPEENMFELDITVHDTDPEAGLGVILYVVDDDLTGYTYNMFGLLPGDHTVTWDADNPASIGVEGIDSDLILDTGNLSFFHIQVDPGTTGAAYDIEYNNLQLAAASMGITGDYNNSGQVEQGDLDLVLQNWGLDTDASGVPAAWTNDLPVGQIEQTELDGVLSNWGATSAPDFTGSAVPEPASALLLGAGALALMRRRLP